MNKKGKIVPQNYYMVTWMSLGMGAFGIPLGVAFSTSLGNMAFLGAGIGMGLAIGVGVGVAMDQQAKKEGRQMPVKL